METALYAKESMAAVMASQFLADDDLAHLTKMQAEIQDTWEKRQIWRTETEMRVSVLNDLKHPTKASKYWQAVREQSVFFENLVALSFEYRRNSVAIKRIAEKAASADELTREELEIDMEEALFKKKNMELAAKDRMREIRLWSKLKAELDDGSFDTTSPNTHQLESFTHRFRAQMKAVKDSESALSSAEAINLTGLLLTTERHAAAPQLEAAE